MGGEIYKTVPLNRLKQFIKEYSHLFRFLGLALLLLLIWVLINSLFPEWVSDLNYAIIKPQANASAGMLRLLGYQIDQDFLVNGCDARIIINNRASICVGPGCSGLELFLIFAGFILLFRGNLRNKLWFMPLGLFLILVLNILRIVALSLIAYHKPEYLDFNHKYTFVIIVYGAIFLLWLIWVNHFATKHEPEE